MNCESNVVSVRSTPDYKLVKHSPVIVEVGIVVSEEFRAANPKARKPKPARGFGPRSITIHNCATIGSMTMMVTFSGVHPQ